MTENVGGEVKLETGGSLIFFDATFLCGFVCWIKNCTSKLNHNQIDERRPKMLQSVGICQMEIYFQSAN